MLNRKEDVIVVGTGMAGLCASLAALERGARVITLEKGNRFGGSMALSGGSIWTFKDMELVKKYIPSGNPLIQNMVICGLNSGHDWLEKHGVSLEPKCDMEEGHGRKAEPSEMTSTLLERIRTLGGQLCLETALADLVYEGGKVRGVVVVGPEEEIVIRCDAIILATGGFQGNAELVTRYVSPNVSHMYVRSNPWSTGDAFLSATRIGAAVTPGLNCFYGHALAAPPVSFDETEFLEMSQKYGPISVAINLNGSRFTDESAGSGEEVLNIAVAHQPKATAFYVLDDCLMETAAPQDPFPRLTIECVQSHGGTVLESDTLDGLCQLMGKHGVHGHRALMTIKKFNADIQNGRTNQLYPERLKHHFPIINPPFTAVPVRSGITFSNGGLDVDTAMRVMRRSTSVSTIPTTIRDKADEKSNFIPGLYAAGCDIGNISHGGYMGGLASALITGRIAGQSAADLALSKNYESSGNSV